MGVQTELFTEIPLIKNDVDVFFEEFLPIVNKLKQEKADGKLENGLACKIWWRSRFSDFITKNNSAPANTKQKKKTWENMKTSAIRQSLHSLKINPNEKSSSKVLQRRSR